MRRLILIFLFIITCVGGGFLFAFNLSKNSPPPEKTKQSIAKDIEKEERADTPNAVQGQSEKNISAVGSVPFVVQAPFANWKDEIFQNACEEASIVMAMGWLNGTKAISQAESQNQILDIAAFEDANFGYHTDTDVHDMVKIFKQKFEVSSVEAFEDISLNDIKSEISKGSIVLVPAFGQALHNPNYTAPGPVAHMLVIAGYDEKTKQFITNDPGTKHGEGYRYDENVLFGAVWAYPSGEVQPEAPKGNLKKAMLVVYPKE